MKLLNDFKTFLFRGNVVDLAVAVVIGTAFTAVVKALVSDLLTPVIAAIFGSPNFANLKFRINGSQFAYGDFLNNLLAFVLRRRRDVLPGRDPDQLVDVTARAGGPRDQAVPGVRLVDSDQGAPLPGSARRG